MALCNYATHVREAGVTYPSRFDGAGYPGPIGLAHVAL
jgi:hypothetical protein